MLHLIIIEMLNRSEASWSCDCRRHFGR